MRMLTIAILPFLLLAARDDEAGFKKIFDGKTLEGWDGDPRLWSVKDGAIFGETTKEKKASGNTFLIWKGGTVEDFELRFEARLPGENNSGVQYRSKDLGKWSVKGYQYDINTGAGNWGKLYSEKGKRGRMAMAGEKVVWPDGAKKKPKPEQLMSKAELDKLEKTKDWNDCAIIARGNTVIHKLNGKVVTELTDNYEALRCRSGILAIQIHAGKPMQIEVRNIRLKTLE